MELFSDGEDSFEVAFLTRETWFDMLVSILGFVSMCRHIVADESRVQEGNRRRSTFPRDPSQARLACRRRGLLTHAETLDVFILTLC